MNTLYIVGLGPGGVDQMTQAAINAVRSAELIVGYSAYIALLGDTIKGKKVFSSSMMEELERAEYAVRAALAGTPTALVASGDACVYGIGGLALERLSAMSEKPSLEIRIEPGITAANAAASLLGAPLMNDYMVVSLSDLLSDSELIRKRLQAACDADIALVLYNPRSKTRTHMIRTALEMLSAARPPECPVGIVRNAYREGQSIQITTIGGVQSMIENIDMFTTLIIAPSQAYAWDKFIITPRGYAKKNRQAAFTL